MTVLYVTQLLEERPNPSIASIMMHRPCLGRHFYVFKHFIKKSNKNFQLDPALSKLLKIAVKWQI
jgi:hypothetical protein